MQVCAGGRREGPGEGRKQRSRGRRKAKGRGEEAEGPQRFFGPSRLARVHARAPPGGGHRIYQHRAWMVGSANPAPFQSLSPLLALGKHSTVGTESTTSGSDPGYSEPNNPASALIIILLFPGTGDFGELEFSSSLVKSAPDLEKCQGQESGSWRKSEASLGPQMWPVPFPRNPSVGRPSSAGFHNLGFLAPARKGRAIDGNALPTPSTVL